MNVIFTSAAIILFYTSFAEASLSVHPGNIKDTLYIQNNNLSIVHITNTGPTSVLDYQLSSDVSWINFSSIIGSINKGDTVSIEITYDISYLQVGSNFADIYIGDPHHGPITVPVEIYFQSTTDINEDFFSGSPVSFSLEQNYPNPFNPATIISFSVPDVQRVTIKIYNLLGNELLTLVDEEKVKGVYSVKVDMSKFSSGIYFYKMKSSNYTITKKMILNK